MPHRKAPLTETGRLRLARCIVDHGSPLRRAAERFQVAPTTANRWADRYRQHGVAGMTDRPPPHQPSSAPPTHRAAHPRAASPRVAPEGHLTWTTNHA
jgi:transposase